MSDLATLLDRVEGLTPAMEHRSALLDETSQFPTEDIADLKAAGLLAAPLPAEFGGCGIGTQPDTAEITCAVLTALGRGNLAVGRVIEAHINALRLVFRYAARDVQKVAADEAAAGRLFALWVTDLPSEPVQSDRHTLRGSKQFCSAAGHAQRAVVTALDANGETRLALVALQAVAVEPLGSGLQGMRAAATGQVLFEGNAAVTFGRPGDYLREPDFSAGAWRTSAVTIGGLQALMAAAIRQIKARGRSRDPHQQARMGQAMMASETARLWVQHAAKRAEHADANPPDAIAYVNLARLAVERSCLEAITLIQRSLGVAAFLRPNPVERLCRDLATYLRQPAADAVLTEAAAYYMHG